MKELKFSITGTIFVPDNAEYEYDFENQIYTFKINDKTYSLIAGLEADDKEIIVTDENLKSHDIKPVEYEDAYFED
jgi:hypothetical protein